MILFLPSILLFFQSSLAMFKSKAFTVRRRYSDFLGLFEKLTVKQSLQGFIIPPPPEKSVVGEWWLCASFIICWMLVCRWMCVFMFSLFRLVILHMDRNDQSEGGDGRPFLRGVRGEKKSGSGEAGAMHFLCRRISNRHICNIYSPVVSQQCFDNMLHRHKQIHKTYNHLPSVSSVIHFPLSFCCCCCRYLQRIVAHPSFLQDPDVRDFLEREEVSLFSMFIWQHVF